MNASDNSTETTPLLLHFKDEEYRKYRDFSRVDKDLDIETTISIDRGVAVLLKHTIAESENCIYWYDSVKQKTIIKKQ